MEIIETQTFAELLEALIHYVYDKFPGYASQEQIVEGLYTFLKYDTTIDDCFEICEIFNNDRRSIRCYKNIMKSIIVGTSYKYCIYTNNIEDKTYDIEYIDEFEKDDLNFDNIEEYWKDEDNMEAICNMIADYIDDLGMTYIEQNETLLSVIKIQKLNKLLKINPFEVFKFSDLIFDKEYTESERIIRDFMEVYNSGYLFDELEFNHQEDTISLREKLYAKLMNRYKNSADFCKALGYIIGNVYENLCIDTKLCKLNKDLIRYLEDEKTTIDVAVERMLNDDIFSKKIINLFIENNVATDFDLLSFNRQQIIKSKKEKILRKFNTYVDEENKAYNIN